MDLIRVEGQGIGVSAGGAKIQCFRWQRAEALPFVANILNLARLPPNVLRRPPIFLGFSFLAPQLSFYEFIIFDLPKSKFLVRQAKHGEASWLRSGPTDTGLKYCGAAGEPGG